MNKVIRLVLSITILSPLAICQLPSTGQCQMMYGSAFSQLCSLPCCKAHMPTAKCPLLKAAAPRDFIDNSLPVFEDALQPLYSIGALALPAPSRIATAIVNVSTAMLHRIMGAPPSLRAPPTNVHLQNA